MFIKVLRAKNKKYLILILTLLFILGINFKSHSLSSSQKQEELRYEVEVILVDIPVYVTDKHGNPVIDLKAEDFVIYEDGREQKISHFSFIQNDSPEIISLVRQYPAARRHFLLLFDLSFASLGGVKRARESGLNFVKEKILPTDLVSVATYSIFHGLNIIVNFTNDVLQLETAIKGLGLIKIPGVVSGPLGFSFSLQQGGTISSGGGIAETNLFDFIGGKSMLVDSALQERFQKLQEHSYKAYVSSYISELRNLAHALNEVQGRKHLLLFSEGFDSKVLFGTQKELQKDVESFLDGKFGAIDSDKRFGDANLRFSLFETLKRLVNSDCLIHTMDIGGLRTGERTVEDYEGIPLKSRRRGEHTLFIFSENTGGRAYRNINNLDKPLENILKLTNSYYLIGYYSRAKEKEGKFHKIKVKVKRPGLFVSHRKGYYEKKPYEEYSPLEKQFQLAEYVTKDIIQKDIEFDGFVTAFQGEKNIAQIPLFLEFPGKQFLKKKRISDEIPLEVYGYAISSKGQFTDFFSQTFKLKPARFKERLRTARIKYYDMLFVPPGNYKIKCIVRNSETGEIGSNIQTVSVPDYESKELLMSGPVFVDFEKDWIICYGYDPEKPAGRKIGMPGAYPFTVDNNKFFPDIKPITEELSPNQVYFKVYNLKLHPETKIPQIEITFETIDQKGNLKVLEDINLVKKPARVEPNAFEFLFVFDLVDLQPGQYQFKVTLTDTLAKRTVTSSAPFVFQ